MKTVVSVLVVAAGVSIGLAGVANALCLRKCKGVNGFRTDPAAGSVWQTQSECVLDLESNSGPAAGSAGTLGNQIIRAYGASICPPLNGFVGEVTPTGPRRNEVWVPYACKHHCNEAD
jgi:hypothetical protein